MKKTREENYKNLEEITHKLAFIENDIQNLEKRMAFIEDLFNELYHKY